MESVGQNQTLKANSVINILERAVEVRGPHLFKAVSSWEKKTNTTGFNI